MRHCRHWRSATRPGDAARKAFNLYNVSAGGATLYTGTRTVAVSNRLFNVLIGSVTPRPPSLLFDVPYWLGVKVGGDAEMTPRQAVGASGYAIRSASAKTLVAGATLTAPVIGTISNSGTLTLPVRAETLVGRSTTDTLINKTNAGDVRSDRCGRRRPEHLPCDQWRLRNAGAGLPCIHQCRVLGYGKLRRPGEQQAIDHRRELLRSLAG